MNPLRKSAPKSLLKSSIRLSRLNWSSMIQTVLSRVVKTSKRSKAQSWIIFISAVRLIKPSKFNLKILSKRLNLRITRSWLKASWTLHSKRQTKALSWDRLHILSVLLSPTSSKLKLFEWSFKMSYQNCQKESLPISSSGRKSWGMWK